MDGWLSLSNGRFQAGPCPILRPRLDSFQVFQCPHSGGRDGATRIRRRSGLHQSRARPLAAESFRPCGGPNRIRELISISRDEVRLNCWPLTPLRPDTRHRIGLCRGHHSTALFIAYRSRDETLGGVARGESIRECGRSGSCDSRAPAEIVDAAQRLFASRQRKSRDAVRRQGYAQNAPLIVMSRGLQVALRSSCARHGRVLRRPSSGGTSHIVTAGELSRRNPCARRAAGRPCCDLRSGREGQEQRAVEAALVEVFGRRSSRHQRRYRARTAWRTAPGSWRRRCR